MLFPKIRAWRSALHNVDPRTVRGAGDLSGAEVSWLQIAIVAGILLVAFALRWGAYDHPLAEHWIGGWSDYMIASHAVMYGEWPLLGPATHSIRLGPSYEYVLVFFALIYNSPAFVNFCFLLLSSATVFGVYLSARRLFGNDAALLSALSVAIAPAFIAEAATFVWEPYVMEPFLVFGFYYLVRGWQERSLACLVTSQLLVLFAFSIYLAVFAFLPLYCVLLGCAVYRLRGVQGVFDFCARGFFVSIILFLPPLLRAGVMHSTLLPTAYHKVYSASQYVGALFNRLDYLLIHRPEGSYCAVVIALAFMLFPFVSQKKKITVCVLVLFLIQQLLIDFAFGYDARPRYFIPVGFIVALLFGAIAHEVMFRFRWQWPLGVAFALLVCVSLSGNYYVVRGTTNALLSVRPNQEMFDRAIEVVSTELIHTRERNGYPDFGFASMRVINRGWDNTPAIMSDSIVIDPIERLLNTRLSRLSSFGRDEGLRGRKEVFVFCLDRGAPRKQIPRTCAEDAAPFTKDLEYQGDIYESAYVHVLLEKMIQKPTQPTSTTQFVLR